MLSQQVTALTGLAKRHFGYGTMFFGYITIFWGHQKIYVQEVLQVTLGVHRYEKCDLIGDDMGDKHECNGYNKTQVSE